MVRQIDDMNDRSNVDWMHDLVIETCIQCDDKMGEQRSVREIERVWLICF